VYYSYDTNRDVPKGVLSPYHYAIDVNVLVVRIAVQHKTDGAVESDVYWTVHLCDN